MALFTSYTISFSDGGASPPNPGITVVNQMDPEGTAFESADSEVSLYFHLSGHWYIAYIYNGGGYEYIAPGDPSTVPGVGWFLLGTTDDAYIMVIDTPAVTPTPTPTITPTRTSPAVTPTNTVTPTRTGPAVAPTSTPTPSVTLALNSIESLIFAFPELEQSLTLNPAGSAEMLDPENRDQENVHSDRALEGEFGYSVRRRLHHMGYNV